MNKPTRSTAPVQVRCDLSRWIAVICQYRGIPQHAFLDPLLREAVVRDYTAAVAEMAAEVAEKESQAQDQPAGGAR